MKHIKSYNNDFDLNVGQYIKIKKSSPFYELFKDEIFKIDKKDNVSFYLKDIYGNYPNIKISEISKSNVRSLTTEEQKELELYLTQNKYNL